MDCKREPCRAKPSAKSRANALPPVRPVRPGLNIRTGRRRSVTLDDGVQVPDSQELGRWDLEPELEAEAEPEAGRLQVPTTGRSPQALRGVEKGLIRPDTMNRCAE